jgi:hypothetical protein
MYPNATIIKRKREREGKNETKKERSCFVCFCGASNQTQTLTHAKTSTLLLSHTSSPYKMYYKKE